MICSKCKSKVKDNLSICPICGSPLKKKTRKVVKNKYIKDESSKDVGGVISNNSSFVNLKKKKVQNEVKRSDYNNYLDYYEAKESVKDEELAKSTKYKSKLLNNKNIMGDGFVSILKVEKNTKPANINEYKESLQKENSQKTGANNSKVKFTKNSAEAAIKTKREKDYAEVGNVTKTKNYSSEIKRRKNEVVNKQDSYQQGRFFNTRPNYNYDVNVTKEVKQKRHPIREFLSYMVVMAVWVLVFVVIFSANKHSYYFDSNDDETPTLNGISKSNQVANMSGSGVTSVIYDNQYLKQMVISSLDDVNKLIVTDSLEQKKACPVEIQKIEKEIVDNYGIVAVNFCEMDKELAEELKNVIAYIYNEFPLARNYLTNITIANVGVNDTYIAAFMPVFTFATSKTNSGYPVGIKTQIVLNAKYFLNPIKLKNSVSSGSNSGYFPSDASSSSTVAHEFGHYLSYVAMLNYYNSKKLNYVTVNEAQLLYSVYADFNEGDFSYKLLQEAYQEYQNNYLSVGSFDEFRQSISRYAMARDNKGRYIYDETIAEAFHDYYLHGESAKPASKVIVEVLRSKL